MNIASYIAYLIGDSKRETIPLYEYSTSGIPLPLSETLAHSETIWPESSPFAGHTEIGIIFQYNNANNPYNGGGLESQFVEFSSNPMPPNPGIYKLYGMVEGEWVSAKANTPNDDGFSNEYHWGLDGSILAEQGLLLGQWYYIPSDGYQGITTSTLIFGSQDWMQLDDYSSYEDTQIPLNILNTWIQNSIIKVSKLMPKDLKIYNISSTEFTAGRPLAIDDDSNSSIGGGIYLKEIDTTDIVSVSRYDGEIAYQCRLIPSHLRSKSKFGSGFLEECSETDPVYYINGQNKIVVEPTPEETHLDSEDGFCVVDYIDYPTVTAISNSLDDGKGFIPSDIQEVVLIGTAIKVKEFQLQKVIISPIFPVINSQFHTHLSNINTNIKDALKKAQDIIDNYNSIDFFDFINNEDIEMATTVLKSSAQELNIVATELSIQDKRAGHYLNQYAQDINKFSQSIKEGGINIKKYTSELEMLKNDYQEGIYALRGEFPNKKQLKDTEKKLETIKQVVQRT